MRDSIGGSFVLIIIVVFLVVAMSYIAFNVNYTKAFRMKNKIISLYKEYDGECNEGECRKEIENYAKKIGYETSKSIVCPKCDDSNSGRAYNTSLYCSCKYTINGKKDSNTQAQTDLGKKYYYHIVTKINIDIPIISNILDLDVFHISGDTVVFEDK